MIKKFLKKTGLSEIEVLKSPLFIGVLLLKITFSFFAASEYLSGMFAKFINYYVASGFQNPYDFFYSIDFVSVFPYSALMLGIMAIPRIIFSPFLVMDYNIVSNIHIFIYRLPMLLADFSIFAILIKWLKTKQKKVLLYYWCSPILLYITYLHGQLDVIPIMFLFVSLYFLFREKFYPASLMIGLAICCKTNILLVVPFYLVYLASKKLNLKKFLLNVLVLPATFFIVNLPYLFTEGFAKIVFQNKDERGI